MTSSAQSVIDFGADRTGLVDSSVAFEQARLASLNETGGDFCDFKAPAGNYRFDRPINPMVGIPTSFRGAGQRLTNLLTSAGFHADFPGRHLMHFSGTGTSDGQVQIRVPATPMTAPTTTEVVSGPFKSGWDPILGSAGADATVVIKTGAVTGEAVLQVSIDQSEDPLFASGVTTASVAFTETEPNKTKSMGNGGIVPNNGPGFWTASYFRIRYGLAGTPTNWPVTITYNNNYNVLVGVDLVGFAINATGAKNSPGMDVDGRWNTKGLFIDRTKWVDLSKLWVNKQMEGIRLREVWDSNGINIKVLKSGGPGLCQMSMEPFNEWVTGSNTNNSTFTQVHLEDGKGDKAALYMGRRTRRIRFNGIKIHGDLASNAVMTRAPHVLMQSAYTNQFFGTSFNRAGESHVVLDIHPAEEAQKDITAWQGSDRNVFVGGYADSARTNPSSPSATASFHVVRGASNRWAGGFTFSSNPRAIAVDDHPRNIDNQAAADCDFHDIYDFSGNLTGDIRQETYGPLFTTWRNPVTKVRYTWDGTTLTPVA